MNGRVKVQRGSARMFENELLEKLSHVHPATPAVLFSWIVVAAPWTARAVHQVPWGDLAWQFTAGYLFWTLVEYWLHRLLFHLKVRGPKTERLYFLIHGVHHDYPWDTTRLVIPPAASVVLAVLFYGLFRAVLGDAMYAAFGGFILGYVLYDTLHWYVHARSPKGRIGKYLRREHMIHHFDRPDTRFGVSCPFWDHVFGTTGKGV